MPERKSTPLNKHVEATVRDVKKTVVRDVKKTVRSAQRNATKASQNGNDLVKVFQNLVKAIPVAEMEKRMAGLEKSVTSLSNEVQKALARVGVMRSPMPSSPSAPAPRKRGRPVGSGKKNSAPRTATTKTTKNRTTTPKSSATTVRSTSSTAAPKPKATTSRKPVVKKVAPRSIAPKVKKITRRSPSETPHADESSVVSVN